MKALIISADNFEDSELLVPYYRLKEAGVKVTVASLKRGTITGKQGYEAAVGTTIDEVNPDDYAILVLPGGKAPAVVAFLMMNNRTMKELKNVKSQCASRDRA